MRDSLEFIFPRRGISKTYQFRFDKVVDYSGRSSVHFQLTLAIGNDSGPAGRSSLINLSQLIPFPFGDFCPSFYRLAHGGGRDPESTRDGGRAHSQFALGPKTDEAARCHEVSVSTRGPDILHRNVQQLPDVPLSPMEPHLLLHTGLNRRFQDVPNSPQAQVKIAEKYM